MRTLLATRLLPAIAVAVIVIVLPWFFPSAYYYRIGALVFIFALAVVGLELALACDLRVAAEELGVQHAP